MGFRRARPLPWPPVFRLVNQAPPPRTSSARQKWPWCQAPAGPEAESCGGLRRGTPLLSGSFLSAWPELRSCPHFAQTWGTRKDPETISDRKRPRRRDSGTQEGPWRSWERLQVRAQCGPELMSCFCNLLGLCSLSTVGGAAALWKLQSWHLFGESTSKLLKNTKF